MQSYTKFFEPVRPLRGRKDPCSRTGIAVDAGWCGCYVRHQGVPLMYIIVVTL